MNGLSTAEQMALLVLRRTTESIQAARELAQHLMEDYFDTQTNLPPVNKLTAHAGNVRVVLYLRPDLNPGVPMSTFLRDTQTAVRQWLRDRDRPLILQGIERIELYELNYGSVAYEEPPPLHRPKWLEELVTGHEKMIQAVLESLQVPKEVFEGRGPGSRLIESKDLTQGRATGRASKEISPPNTEE